MQRSPFSSKRPRHADPWPAFRAGDPQALTDIFTAHYEALFNYGLKIVCDEVLVEDCIQEVFGELWQHRDSLAGQVSSVRFYLLTSLRMADHIIHGLDSFAIRQHTANVFFQLYIQGQNNPQYKTPQE